MKVCETQRIRRTVRRSERVKDERAKSNLPFKKKPAKWQTMTAKVGSLTMNTALESHSQYKTVVGAALMLIHNC